MSFIYISIVDLMNVAPIETMAVKEYLRLLGMKEDGESIAQLFDVEFNESRGISEISNLVISSLSNEFKKITGGRLDSYQFAKDGLCLIVYDLICFTEKAKRANELYHLGWEIPDRDE